VWWWGGGGSGAKEAWLHVINHFSRCEVAEAYIQLILAATPEVRCVRGC
jgi:hypothetical protein